MAITSWLRPVAKAAGVAGSIATNPTVDKYLTSSNSPLPLQTIGTAGNAYNLITNPPTGQQAGSGTYSAGSGSGTQSAADAAYYDSLTNDANSQLGRLDTQAQVGQDNINNSYTNSLNQLLGQHDLTKRNYDTSKQQSLQDYTQGRGNVQYQVGQQSNALQRLLGAHGYSGSGNVAANYGAAREGSIQNQQLGQSFAHNNQSLDQSFGDYQNQYNGQLGGLDAQKKNQQNTLQSTIQQNKADLLSQLAQIAQARTGSAAAGQGYRDQVNQIGANIDQLGRQYQNPAFNVQQPTYNAPTLDSYTVKPQATPTVAGAPGAGDNLNPFLSLLLGTQDKRNQNNFNAAIG